MDTKELVKERYGEIARAVARKQSTSCCGASSVAVGGGADPITSGLYSGDQAGDVPADALAASLGCGNPTKIAGLKTGEVVLDLGSGGGIDVLLAARKVGAAGKAYGLDMTDDMLALARENRRKAGVQNAEFLKGEIENIPLPPASVDVIISNCVINLSADKDRVFADAFRVLRPGGRMAISDIVVRGEMDPEIRRSVELLVGCVAGALEENDYRARLARAGFEAVEIEPFRIYGPEDAQGLFKAAGIDPRKLAPAAGGGQFMSASIRARKPAACCG
jgi:arsenite methyltransferase